MIPKTPKLIKCELEASILNLALMYEALMDLVSDLIASIGGVGDIHQDLRFQGRSEPCPSIVGIHIRV